MKFAWNYIGKTIKEQKINEDGQPYFVLADGTIIDIDKSELVDDDDEGYENVLDNHPDITTESTWNIERSMPNIEIKTTPIEAVEIWKWDKYENEYCLYDLINKKTGKPILFKGLVYTDDPINNHPQCSICY